MPSAGKGSKIIGVGGGAAALGTLGWAQYGDTIYTEVSPLVVGVGAEVLLTNNAGNNITSQLPVGVDKLYDGSTNKITPVNLGDGYNLRIDFERYSTSQAGYGEIKLHIGGTQGVIMSIPVEFPRGTGSENSRPFTVTEFVYSFTDFINNGGSLSYESIRGTTSIYNIRIIIAKVIEGK